MVSRKPVITAKFSQKKTLICVLIGGLVYVNNDRELPRLVFIGLLREDMTAKCFSLWCNEMQIRIVCVCHFLLFIQFVSSSILELNSSVTVVLHVTRNGKCNEQAGFYVTCVYLFMIRDSSLFHMHKWVSDLSV